jgi:hypothetical protein
MTNNIPSIEALAAAYALATTVYTVDFFSDRVGELFNLVDEKASTVPRWESKNFWKSVLDRIPLYDEAEEAVRTLCHADLVPALSVEAVDKFVDAGLALNKRIDRFYGMYSQAERLKELYDEQYEILSEWEGLGSGIDHYWE